MLVDQLTDDQLEQLVLEMARNVATQDNRMTRAPVFEVLEREDVAGTVEDYTMADREVFVDVDGDEYEPTDFATKEKCRNGVGGRSTVNIVHKWNVVATLFTQRGADDYIARHKHNYAPLRVHVASGYRNAEWEVIREHLLRMAARAEVRRRDTPS